MLTTTPKVGDRVLVVAKSRCDREKKLLPIEKVGRKWLTIELQGIKQQFSFEGRNEWFELFDSQEAYDRYLQRDRNISKIKKTVDSWDFGNGLSDETLEQIVKLIEVTP